MIWEQICSVVLEWSWEPDANGIVFVLESIYEVKTIFSTHKYVSAWLVHAYCRLVDVKVGVMCIFAQASPILVNGLNWSTVAWITQWHMDSCENLLKNVTSVMFIFSINEKGLDEPGCSLSP